MWVRFTADFDFKPKPQVTLAFLAGEERNVTRDCAEKAVAAGKAVRVKKAKSDGEATDSRQP
jgi:hypothetical protein